MSDIVTMLKRRAAHELEKKVNGALPASMQLRLNPEAEDDEDEEGEEGEEAEDDEEEDEEGDEDADDEGDDEDVDPPLAVAFEDATREDNLACAVAAYRVGGGADCIVASHETGPAFFGTEEALDEYSTGKDLSDEGWDVYDDSNDIFGMEYDHDTLKRVIKMMEEQESKYESAEDFYQKFHWGNPANVQVVKNIPGVTGTLAHLGVARKIEYGASKDGKWDEYYHMFGEDSKVFPSIYAVMNEGETEPTCLVIHGGNMRIEPRGIVE